MSSNGPHNDNNATNTNGNGNGSDAKMDIDKQTSMTDDNKKRKAGDDSEVQGDSTAASNKDDSKMDVESQSPASSSTATAAQPSSSSSSSLSSSSSSSSSCPSSSSSAPRPLAEYSSLSAKDKIIRLSHAYAQQVRIGCKESAQESACVSEFCVGNGRFVSLTGKDAAAKALELVKAHFQQPKLCPRIARKFAIPISPPPLPTPTYTNTNANTPPLAPPPLPASSASLSPASTPVAAAIRVPPPKEVIVPLTVDDVCTMVEAARATTDYSQIIRRVGQVCSDLDALANSFPAANTIIRANAPHSSATFPRSTASSSSSSSSTSSSSSSSSASASSSSSSASASSSGLRSPMLSSITPPLPAAPSSSSPDAMSLEESKAVSPPDCEPTNLSPAVDFADLDAVFELLTAEIENPAKGSSASALRDALGGAFLRLLMSTPAGRATLSSSSSFEFTPRLLRAFFIIFHCPLLLDPERKALNRQLFRCLAVLNTSTRSVFITWLIALDKEQLERLLGTVQQYITLSWINRVPLEEIIPAVRVLGYIEEANEMRKRRFPKLEHVDYAMFYNDAINEDVSVREEFIRWMRNEPTSLSTYPFILEPAVKSRMLQYESIYEQRRRFDQDAFASMLFQTVSPYLVLRVHRDELIRDALSILQTKDSNELKKPLKVHFIGESGIDEGGLQREFFQLLVSQLFDPKYGMFTHDNDTRTHRINPASLESHHEFELIGILLGLALYNTVILDIRLPLYYYKKLMGEKLTYEDFRCAYPAIAKGFDALLNFDGDVENTFVLTFTGTYESFGESVVEELKSGGKDISVSTANRQEYVELYTDWLMNKSVEKPFKAFREGILMVCGGDGLRLFRSEEMELLICGSPELDFHALESVTRYEEGFTKDSPTVRHFWSIVHTDLTLDQKKKLLHFATGSDRAPIRGLGSMAFIIARHGPDSDALPSSHTCFGILCLPDFGNRDKLKSKLLLAIQHATGFGLV